MLKNGMRPIHPGEILREEFQREMVFSAAAFRPTWRYGYPFA